VPKIFFGTQIDVAKFLMPTTLLQVFYFAPQKLWYLIYQTGANAAYSTNSDVGNPSGWSTPKNFYSGGMPSIVKQNIGTGNWVDFWNICDQVQLWVGILSICQIHFDKTLQFCIV
jgi:hypothetical protein